MINRFFFFSRDSGFRILTKLEGVRPRRHGARMPPSFQKMTKGAVEARRAVRPQAGVEPLYKRWHSLNPKGVTERSVALLGLFRIPPFTGVSPLPVVFAPFQGFSTAGRKMTETSLFDRLRQTDIIFMIIRNDTTNKARRAVRRRW